MIPHYPGGSHRASVILAYWNPVTTASAIDRVVHHTVIMKFDVTSYRTKDRPKKGGTPNTGAGAEAGGRTPGEAPARPSVDALSYLP